MAHRRSFGGRGISASQRRKKSWIQVTGPSVDTLGGIAVPDVQTPNMNLFVPVGTNAVAGFSSNSSGLFSDPTLDKIPAESTILRLRGSVNLPKNTVGAGAINNFAIGIGVMESRAAVC